MKKVLLLLVAFATIGVANAQDSFDDTMPMMDIGNQFEITPSFVSVAISDGYDTYSANGLQLTLAYDLVSSGFMLAPEVDLNLAAIEDQVVFGVIPGLKIGHDNIYFVGSYNFKAAATYYGIGGFIPVSDNGGITLQLQGGNIDGLGVGYGSVGYTFKL